MHEVILRLFGLPSCIKVKQKILQDLPALYSSLDKVHYLASSTISDPTDDRGSIFSALFWAQHRQKCFNGRRRSI